MKRLLVTGCGRSGTGFLARVLHQSGVPSGHEAVFHPSSSSRPSWGNIRAEASWLAVPWLPTLPSDVEVVHVVRDPIDNANSFRAIGMFEDEPAAGHRPYLDAISRYAPGVLGYPSALERWLAYWVTWNEAAERATETTFRIELLDDLRGRPLARHVDELGLAPTEAVLRAWASTPKNVNHRGQCKELVGLDAILKLDPVLVRRFVFMCIRYGYRVAHGDRMEES